jgi:hypothetical protein
MTRSYVCVCLSCWPLLHYADADLWDHIDGFAEYLTKVDYFIKLLLPKGMRSFGCSKTVKPFKNKPGPKRQLTPPLTSQISLY